ncbi:GNAT family N-acetyltransferase [Streptomyces odontomachi]|uniref:GNAT family N-acetyltransferase n=1 Tax=Streptomyces odontomachi TaxID=2944940 RepID=UPI00210A63BA|nr:GNAT family N-acetyltransferase [Streptomyces sp. ODS25]
MKMIDLEPGDARLTGDLLPVLHELRPHLTAELLQNVYEVGYAEGLRFTAAYDDEGSCIAAAGWRVINNTSSIRKMHIDDLVTVSTCRSTGVGGRLLSYLEDRARSLDCRVVQLDSGTQRTDAHRFYLRQRFGISAFHFSKRPS